MLNLDRHFIRAGNHSAEASSTTCYQETFQNLTKEQYPLIFYSPTFGLWIVCVFSEVLYHRSWTTQLRKLDIIQMQHHVPVALLLP